MAALELRHLIMIREVFRTGSVSETAARLGLTQSAVSHRMREAERRVQARLFVKSGRKIGFTSAAERLLLVAESVLGEIERVEQDIEKLSAGFDDVVRIGGGYYTPYDWLPGVQAALWRDMPRVALEIPTRPLEDGVTELSRGAIDIAIMLGRSNDPQVESTLLATDELVAVAASSHAFAGRAVVGPSDLTGVTYITHHTRPERGREYELLFTRHGILPRRVVSAGVTEAVLQLVQAGEGVTILPRRTVRPYLRGFDLVTLPLEGAGPGLEWHGLRRTRDRDRPAVAALARLVQQVFAAA